MSGIGLRNVVKTFPNGVRAVDGVDLTIDDGEFIVLVGPSRLREDDAAALIAGLEEVDDGAIVIGDRDVTDVAPKDRDIAMVFQSYALYPHMNVRKNIGFGLKLAQHAAGRDRPRASTRPRDCSVSRTCSTGCPPQLSGGQRQRVAMGRAIARRPQRLPLGRAALEPRREAARRVRADLAQLHAPARRDDGLRHPRPGGGDDARPARRRHEEGRSSSSARRRRSTDRPPTCSSPPSSARRR